MFRTSCVFRNPSLVGLVSPFLCTQQPQVLREVLDTAKTRENVNLIMQEVMREHLIRDRAPIFRETENLVCASKEMDPKSYSTHLLRFVKENRTDLPLFDVFLKNAGKTQINEALKEAMKNGNINSVKKILPHVKDKQTTLDEMFMNLRNETKLSHEIIRDLLPLCSYRVKERYFNEMIIQKDLNALRIITEFFQPTKEHQNLANTHFSDDLIDVPKRTPGNIRDRFLGITGMVNFSFCSNVIEGVKDTGKQIVLPIQETVKLALRRMGLIAGPSELVIFDSETNLENLNGLVPRQYDEDSTSEQVALSMIFDKKTSILGSLKEQDLLSSAQVAMLSESERLAITGSPVIVKDLGAEIDGEFFVLPKLYQNNQDELSDGFGLTAAANLAFSRVLDKKTSILGSMKDSAFLSSEQVATLSERARLAITGGRVIVEDLDAESDHEFFITPRVYQNNQDESSDGFGRTAAATVAVLATGALMDDRKEEIEPSFQVAQEQAKKETSIVPQKQEENVVAEQVQVVQTPVSEEEVEPSSQVAQEQTKEEDTIIHQKQEELVVAKQALASEEKAAKSLRYNAIAQMKADRKAGYWRL